MDRKQNTPQEWLEAATKGIRFGPDRLAVEAELREHLEDKTADNHVDTNGCRGVARWNWW